MDGSIYLKPSERKTLLEYYRKSSDPAIRLRAHILLLLADAHPWSRIAAMLYTSTSTIRRWKDRFRREGLAEILESRRGRPVACLYGWAVLAVRWVTEKTPRDFGFLRSRWSCATVVLLLLEQRNVQVSAETQCSFPHTSAHPAVGYVPAPCPTGPCVLPR
jgi:putative transposase